jgi:PAS domain S-box-containing protein
MVYLLTAVYLGRNAEKLKTKNKELQMEIDMRKSAEKELKENLSLMESLMSTLPTPVCFKDLNYKFTGCNTAYEEYFGLSEEEIIGRSAHELFDASIADVCLEMDIDLLENKVRHAREVSFISKEGQQKFFIFTKALLSDEEGNPIGIVSVFLDTTDQKEQEKLRIRIEEEKLIIDEMQKYDLLKTEFFSNISHELRTPLNVIFCAVQLLEISLSGGHEPIDRNFVKKNVMSIKQNSLRLLRLVNNLIDITKIDAQAFDIRLHNQDIVYVVREIVLSVADYITNKGLKLVFHSEIKEKVMALDEEKIERIMLNLLSNAIKFSPPGESIYVDITEKECGICIKVCDKGIGIPPDRRQDIFQRFYQISPMHTRLREGSGIGLNLVKSLVEMHQGTITVDSEYGKGTSFLIELPVLLVPEDKIDKEEYKDRQARIESIRLEFSDIYLANEHENRAAVSYNLK